MAKGIKELRRFAEDLERESQNAKAPMLNQFSVLDQLIQQAPPSLTKGPRPGTEWRSYLQPGRMLTREDVQFPLKKEEIQYSNLQPILDSPDPISHEDLLDRLRTGRPEFGAKHLSKDGRDDLEHLYRARVDPDDGSVPSMSLGRPQYSEYGHESPHYEEMLTTMPGVDTYHQHFQGYDPLFWSRGTTQQSPSGALGQLIEEIQSDHHARAAEKNIFGEGNARVGYKKPFEYKPTQFTLKRNASLDDLVSDYMDRNVTGDPDADDFDEAIGRAERQALRQAGNLGRIPGLGKFLDKTELSYPLYQALGGTDSLSDFFSGDVHSQYRQFLRNQHEGTLDPAEFTGTSVVGPNGEIHGFLPNDPRFDPIISPSGKSRAELEDEWLKALQDEDRQNAESAWRVNQRDVPTDAPFKSAPEYADFELRKQLMAAAQRNYDFLGSVSGKDQIDRYKYLNPEQQNGMKYFYDQVLPGRLEKLAKQYGLQFDPAFQVSRSLKKPSSASPDDIPWPMANRGTKTFDDYMAAAPAPHGIEEFDNANEYTDHVAQIQNELNDIHEFYNPRGRNSMPDSVNSAFNAINPLSYAWRDADTPEMKAQLSSAIDLLYGHAVSKAADTIRQTMKGGAGDYKPTPSIVLTPEAREKIRRIGVPLWSLLGGGAAANAIFNDSGPDIGPAEPQEGM